MARVLRYLLWFIAAVVLLIVAATIAIHLTLKSGWASEKILPRVKGVLAANGVDLDLEHLSIDLFRHIILRNVHLVWRGPRDQTADVTIPEVNIRFSLLGILQRRMDVTLVEVTRPEFKVVLKPEPSPPPPPPPEPAKDPVDLIRDLPAQLGVKTVRLNDASMDVTMRSPGSDISVVLHGLGFELEAEAVPGHVSAKLSVTLKPQDKDKVALLLTPSPDDKTSVSLRPEFAIAAELDLKVASDKQSFTLTRLAGEVHLVDLMVSQKAAAGAKLDVAIPRINLAWAVSAKSQHQGALPDNEPKLMKMLFPLTIDVNESLDVNGGGPIVISQHAPGAKRMKVSVKPKQRLVVTGNVADPSDIMNSEITKLAHALELAGLDVALIAPGGPPLHIKSRQIRVDLESTLRAREGKAEIDVTAAGTSVAPHLPAAHDFFVELAASTGLDLQHPQADIKVAVDKMALLNTVVRIDNLPRQLDVAMRSRISAPRDLAGLHPGAKILGSLGALLVNMDNNVSVAHDAESALKVDWANVAKKKVTTSHKIVLAQVSKPWANPWFFRTSKPIEINLRTSSALPSVSANLALAAGDIHVPQLDGSIRDVKVATKVEGDLDQRGVVVDGKVDLDGRELVDYHVDLKDRPKHLTLGLVVNAVAGPYLASVMGKLSELQRAGTLGVRTRVDLDVAHGFANAQGLTPATIDSTRGTLQVRTAIEQRGAPSPKAEPRVVLGKPSHLAVAAQWGARQAKVRVSGDFPEVAALPFAELRGLSLQAEALARPMMAPEDMSWSVLVKNGTIRVLQIPAGAPDPSHLLKDLVVTTSGSLRGKRYATLDKLSVGLGKDLVFVTTRGRADLVKGGGDAEGDVSVTLPKKFVVTPTSTASGKISLPWSAAQVGRNRIVADAAVVLKNVQFNGPGIAVEGIDGSIRLGEELEITDNKRIRFAYLLDRNPFERVDYARLQPLLTQAQGLQIRRIAFDGKEIGPLRANIFILQNYVAVPEFDLDIFGGTLSGQFFVNTRPQSLQVGLLSRLTQLDPRRALPEAFKQRGEDKRISARTAIIYDVNRSVVQGRVDITDIGSDQLITLINILDPKYEDDQLNNARFALKLAYPTYVGLMMQQGSLDMKIDLGGALPKTIEVRRIPLSSFMSSAMAPATQKLKSVPLD